MVVYRLVNNRTGAEVASFRNKLQAREFIAYSPLALRLEVDSNKARFYYDTDDNKTFFVHPIGKPALLVGVCDSEQEAKEYTEWCNKHHF